MGLSLDFPVPFIYISASVLPPPYCSGYRSFVVWPEVRQPVWLCSFSILLLLLEVFCVPIESVNFFHSSSVKNVLGNLIGIVLNL